MSPPTSRDRAPRGLRRRLPVAAALVLALVVGGAAGCTSASGEADPRITSTAAASAAVAEVADAQRTVDTQLTEAVRRLRLGDETVRRVRAPATFATAVADLEEVRAEVAELETRPADDALDSLRVATDQALEAVAGARAEAEEANDAWLTEYLAAERRVLQAVGDHADTGEELLGAIGPHRAALLEALEAIASTVEGRDDPAEAEEVVAAIQLEVLPLFEALIEAQEVTAEANEARAASAEVLNQASADAAAVAERRPGR